MTQPLLIIQGMNDRRVPRTEAERMVSALNQRGVFSERRLLGREALTP